MAIGYRQDMLLDPLQKNPHNGHGTPMSWEELVHLGRNDVGPKTSSNVSSCVPHIVMPREPSTHLMTDGFFWGAQFKFDRFDVLHPLPTWYTNQYQLENQARANTTVLAKMCTTLPRAKMVEYVKRACMQTHHCT